MKTQRTRILEAAVSLFLKDGYDGVSVEAIATSARVSKTAIYGNFGDKEGLFDAVVEFSCADVGAPAIAPAGDTLDLKAILLNAGQASAYRILQPKATRLMRLVLGSYGSNSKLAKKYWQIGPVWAVRHVEDALTRVKKQKKRRQMDPGALAIEFLNESVGSFLFTTLLGVTKYPSKKDIDDALTRIVDEFIRRHRLD